MNEWRSEWKEEEVQTAYQWKFEELKETASGIINGFRYKLNFVWLLQSSIIFSSKYN
jgi:hypothetical protein